MMQKVEIPTGVLEFSESSCVSSTSHTNKIFCLKLCSWSFPFFAALKLRCSGLFSLTLRWQLVQSEICPKENSCKTPEDEVRAVTSGTLSHVCTANSFKSRRASMFGPGGHWFESSGKSTARERMRNMSFPPVLNFSNVLRFWYFLVFLRGYLFTLRWTQKLSLIILISSPFSASSCQDFTLSAVRVLLRSGVTDYFADVLT